MKGNMQNQPSTRRYLTTPIVLLSLALCQGAATGQDHGLYAWRNYVGMPGGPGNTDGVATAPRFNQPTGVAMDTAGNRYVADCCNHTIRKVSNDGVTTTLAGSPGVIGSADGTGSAARFNYPYGVAVDGAGTVYVADTYNQTIRQVTSAGVVTTLAGSPGLSGSADGAGSAASFSQPVGVAVDHSGNVYVADTFNCTIRKVTSAGVVTTLAGNARSSGGADGAGSAARFYLPQGVAVDGAGTVYVADTYNHTIRQVTSAGEVTTLAGLAGASGSTDATGSAARFNHPAGVAVHEAGSLYVTDGSNQTIRKMTSSGVVTTLAGSVGSTGSDDGTGSGARFDYPKGVAADGGGNAYVADAFNHTIRKVTSSGVVTTLAGTAGQAGSGDSLSIAARFDNPRSVAVDAWDNVYVADFRNRTIRKIASSGVVTTLAGSTGIWGSADGTGCEARFFWVAGVAVDSGGDVYVADYGSHTIRKVTTEGVVTTLAGSAGHSGTADGTGSAARFYQPTGLAVDEGGNVYVADYGNHTIRKVTSDGVVTTLAGTGGQHGSTDATGSAARFYNPAGVAVDSGGNVYVADSYNFTIRKVTSGGVVTTLAGTARQVGSSDGTGSAARFRYPMDVALDFLGNVYVADRANSTIRKVTSGGVVTTVAGTAGQLGSADGPGGTAQFRIPYGVAVDSHANVYVADTGNGTIRKVTIGGLVTTLAGSPVAIGSADGIGAAARFYNPFGVALDSGGNLYVADTVNCTIRRMTSDQVMTTLAGSAGAGGSEDGTGSAAQFGAPYGLAADSTGNVYVADYANDTIRKVTSAGVVTTLAGSAGVTGSADGKGSAAQFGGPFGLALDSAGNLYVADSGNCTVRKVTSGGVVTTLAGSAGNPGSADGAGADAQFTGPQGVAVDREGNVYVADSGNDTIRKVTSGGVVTTLAGSAGNIGTNDGVGSAARFNAPIAVAVDSAGNVYVADSWNYTIRKVTSDGVVTTIGGMAGVAAGADGVGSAALFNGPWGIALDSAGCLYVAQPYNNCITKGTPLLLRSRPSGSRMVVSWPSLFPGLALQQNPGIASPGGWQASGYTITDDGTNQSVTVASPPTRLFFRLVGN
jgi:hypothetical protein